MSVYIPKRKDGSAKSPFFHYSFTLQVGGRSRKFSGSTGQRTRRAAEAVEDKKRKEAALGLIGAKMTMKEACDQYWDEVGSRSDSEHAKNETLSVLADLVLHYGADTPIVSITPVDVNSAKQSKRASPVIRKGTVTEKFPGDARVNRTVVEGLRRVLRRARYSWGIPVDLTQFKWGGNDGLKIDAEVERTRQLTAEEELAIWEHLPEGYHDLIELYIISGKRKSIWLTLKKTQVSIADRTVRIRLLKKKGGWQWKTYDLTDREVEIIEKAMGGSDKSETSVFTAPSRRPGDKGKCRPITQQMILDAFNAAKKAAGIEDLRIHDLRHTFASRAIDGSENPNLKALQEALDHSSIKSTMRYVHLIDAKQSTMKLREGVRVNRALPENVTRLKRRDG